MTKFIEDRTRSYWEKNKRPYLLSQLAPDLSANRFDYQKIISPLRLRQFLELHMGDTVRVIGHPTQKPKIGIIPISETYVFDPIEAASRGNLRRSSGHGKLVPVLWEALITPIESGLTRYVSLGGTALQLIELPTSSVPPAGLIPIEHEFIHAGDPSTRGPADVFRRFHEWTQRHGLNPDLFLRPDEGKRFVADERRARLLIEFLNALDPDDLDRVQIPLRVIAKLLAKR